MPRYSEDTFIAQSYETEHRSLANLLNLQFFKALNVNHIWTRFSSPGRELKKTVSGRSPSGLTPFGSRLTVQVFNPSQCLDVADLSQIPLGGGGQIGVSENDFAAFHLLGSESQDFTSG